MMPAQDIVRTLGQALLQSDIRRAKESGGFPPLGEDFDFLAYALDNCRGNHAQLAQDLWVLHELDGRRGGFFVEFGAGDGVVLSNTFLLEKAYGWSGILAEPNGVFQAALRRNRRAYVSSRCIAARSGESVTFNQTEDPHFSTLEQYTAADGHAALRRSGTRVPATTQTLRDLLREARAPRRIDYLSIDTEGSEYEILAGFDFSEYDVALLTVEHNHTPREREIDDLLAVRGFRRKFAHLSDFDAWYVNPALVPQRPGRARRAAREGLLAQMRNRLRTLVRARNIPGGEGEPIFSSC